MSEIGDISGGTTPSTKVLEYWGGDIPWLTPSEISHRTSIFISSTERYITQVGLNSSSMKLLPAGTVMMTSRATIGEVAINTLPMSTNQGFINIICNDSEIINLFLAYWIKNNKHVIESRAHGVTFKEILKSSFKSLTILLPPLPEQRAIAHVLQSVQNAIHVRRKEIALERERKAALMQYLFTHGIHNEPTKQSEIGEIPESWQIAYLRDLCTNGSGLIQTGPFGSQLHASDYREQGVPIINPTHLGINTIIEDHLPFISFEDAKRLARHSLEEGDILVSRRGDFSRYAYITSRQAGWLCGTGCLLIRLRNPQVDNYFFAVSIGTEHVQRYLAYNAIGSTMPNLNAKILEGLPLALPSSSHEQHEIARILRACDSKITALEKELSLYEELFQALLEELMTGRLSTVPLLEKEIYNERTVSGSETNDPLCHSDRMELPQT
jgi:type I restriction enzyme S subunit